MNRNVKVKGECSKYPIKDNDFSSYYDEKSVGSMTFYKCQTCPYMALAEDDIKIHLFTTHASLARQNGLLENIELPCPGCVSVFDSDSDIRTHLKKHHKMGLKDIKKLVKSLMQVAIKTPKLKKQKVEDSEPLNEPLAPMDLNIPQVIEIIPDIVLSNTASANGISVITLDELQSMTMPNFEKVDPKEIIKEASINIVYADDSICHSETMTNVTNNTPDLISSVQSAHNIIHTIHQPLNNNLTSFNLNDKSIRSKVTVDSKKSKVISKSKLTDNPPLKNVSNFSKVKLGFQCTLEDCSVTLQSEQKLKYHLACHFNGKMRCPECSMLFVYIKTLHTHLWKTHSVDMELPTCEQCGYKTFSLHRLNNIHKKIHSEEKKYQCTVCSKTFKNTKQLVTHRLIHKERVKHTCSVCQRGFKTKRQHRIHISVVHDKIKPFLCGYCGYSTSSKTDLKLHIRMHTGEKPYSCQECNFKTGDHNSFRRHKRKHSASKYYSCKHCSYKCIQASTFKVHLLNNHADLKTDDVQSCPYCSYTTVNKSNFLSHLSSHQNEKNIQAVILGTKTQAKQCTKPPKDVKACTNFNKSASSGKIELHGCDKDCDIVMSGSKATDVANCCPPVERETVSIEIDGCELQTESVAVNETLIVNSEYAKHHSANLTYTSSNANQTRIDYVSEPIMTPNSSSSNVRANQTQNFSYCNNILNGNIPLPSPVSTSKINESNFISIMPRNQIGNINLHNKSANIPLLTSQTSARLPFINSHYQVSSFDSTQRNSKVTGPIIKPSQILPVPSQGTNRFTESDIHPRKKPKISVKSNLILKGPDEMNMFHSQQKMAFKRLEDNEHRINMNNPISFNNLYNSQFMQLPNEPVLADSCDNSLQNLLPFTADNMLSEPDIIQSDNSSNSTSKLFNYDQDISVKNLNIISQQIREKHSAANNSPQCNNSSYIKLESHQNMQYSLMDKIRNENILLNAQDILNDYCKTSPPLEELHKNVSEIKNEVKADIYSSQPLTTSVRSSPSLVESNIIDNITNNNEFYVPHMDLMVLPDIFDCGPNQWQDIIEIDDNSNDNKQLTKFDTLPISPLLHNDFCFLDNESPIAMSDEPLQDVSRNSCQVQFMSESRKTVNTLSQRNQESDFSVYINGSADPMMNAAAKSAANKINVKNIELMMSTEFMKDN